MATRSQQLADAFLAVATANHYMVGIVERYTDDELAEAYQILIDREGAKQPDSLELALDLCEHAMRERRLR